MSKIAFIFPGQGAQYVGMGKDLYDKFDVFKATLDKANKKLDEDLSKLCFSGPEEELKLTRNTQPAVLAVSVGIANILINKGITPDAFAGLSLGEYAALVTSGSLDFEDALLLVRYRGEFMQNVVPPNEGGMAAVLGLDSDKVIALCKECSNENETVEAVNFNCPGQIVVSGNRNAVTNAAKKAKEAGAKRVVELSVSAPFHSSLLKPAGEKLAKYLADTNIKMPKKVVISNVDAKPYNKSEQIRENLIKQVSSPVLWEQSIRYMIENGIDTFIEVGPGKSLTGFMRKIARDVKCFNVQDVKSLEKTLEVL